MQVPALHYILHAPPIISLKANEARICRQGPSAWTGGTAEKEKRLR